MVGASLEDGLVGRPGAVVDDHEWYLASQNALPEFDPELSPRLGVRRVEHHRVTSGEVSNLSALRVHDVDRFRDEYPIPICGPLVDVVTDPLVPVDGMLEVRRPAPDPLLLERWALRGEEADGLRSRLAAAAVAAGRYV